MGVESPSIYPGQAISTVAFFSAQTRMDIEMDIGAHVHGCPQQISAWAVSGSEACDLISVPSSVGNTSGSHARTMTFETRIALFLMEELVAALRANAPDLIKRWLYRGGSDR